MKLTIHRGNKEIGGTLVEIKSKTTRILIDAGYPIFLNNKPIEKRLASLDCLTLLNLGVLPKISGLYEWDEPTFDAVLISHAHLDHYGLLKYIHPSIPIYLSAGTETIIRLSQTFKIFARFPINSRLFKMYENFSVGNILISPFLMDHSAFDAAAFELKAEGKTVIYTGDFRGHGRKSVCLDVFIRQTSKKANVLLIEGTMLGRTDELPKKESDLEKEIVQDLRDHPLPVLFQSSSQNIDRLVTFYRAAIKLNRIFVVDVYTANVLYELHKLGNNIPYPSLEYKNIKVFYPLFLTDKVFEEIGNEYAYKFSEFRISRSQLENDQRNAMMIVRPNMLVDIRSCGFQGGILYYSMWRGYRDDKKQIKFESEIERLMFEIKPLHTSGHASIPDIQKLIIGLNPQKVIPIHTMLPQEFIGISDKTELKEDGVEFEI